MNLKQHSMKPVKPFQNDSDHDWESEYRLTYHTTTSASSYTRKDSVSSQLTGGSGTYTGKVKETTY